MAVQPESVRAGWPRSTVKLVLCVLLLVAAVIFAILVMLNKPHSHLKDEIGAAILCVTVAVAFLLPW
jgi:hypothetical protein